MLKWLCDNEYLNNSDRSTTHTLMTGGVVGVPDEHYDEFLRLYAAEVKSKNKTLSFSELRSDPVFCMYFDIDLLDTCVTSAEVTSKIFSILQSMVKSYYTGSQSDDVFRCVVCDTAPKEVVVEGDDGPTKVLTKNGYHITFPDLRVTLPQALQLRHSVVCELEKTMGLRPEGVNAWSDAIDKAPYTNGLKMCGSFKRVKCIDCKKSDPAFKDKKKSLLSSMAKVRRKIHPRASGFDYSDLSDIHADEFKDTVFGDMYGKYLELTGFNSCRTCLNTGKVVEKRTYMPFVVLDGSGDSDNCLLDVLREDYYEVMKYTSIRCQSGESETTGYKIPKGVPKAPTEDNGANCRHFSSDKLSHLGTEMRAFAVNNDMYLSDAQTIHLWKGPRVLDARRLSVIEKFVRENVCSAYSTVQIRKVCESQISRRVSARANGGSKMMRSLVGAYSRTMPPSQQRVVSNRYLVNIAGVGSTYCMNKGAEHTSNSVYFIIDQDFCYQRCFSRKSDVRAGGTTCAEFKSGGVRVPAWVSSALFSDGSKSDKSVGPVRPGKCLPTGPATVPAVGGPKRKKKRCAIDWGVKKL